VVLVLGGADLLHRPAEIGYEERGRTRHGIGRHEGDSAEAALLQRAIAAGPMAVRRADR